MAATAARDREAAWCTCPLLCGCVLHALHEGLHGSSRGFRRRPATRRVVAVPLAPKGVLGRFCDCGCVVARRPSRSVIPCRPRPRGPRTPWVRLNSNRRCGERARRRRRLDSASTAAAKAVSCTPPRGLEAPRACAEVSTTRSGPRRPTRALSLPPLHPDAPRSLCRPRSRHNHRAAARRSARPPSHERVSRPPRRRKPTPCLKG